MVKITERLKRQLAASNGSRGVFRNMAVLAAGTGAAKAITLAVIPVLTRLYTPESFGALSIFTSLITLFVPVLTLRYNVAIPLPRTDKAAVNLLAFSYGVLLAASLVLAVILWLGASTVLPALSMDVLIPYWWLIALGAFGTAAYELMTFWAARQKQFKPQASTQVWQALSGSAVKLGFGVAGAPPVGLLLGQAVQQSGGVLYFIRYFWASIKSLWPSVSVARMRCMLLRYSDMPKYRLPSQILLVFATKVPLLFSAVLFGAATTGQLGLAFMALGVPIQLFGTTTGRAYYSEIAKLGQGSPTEIKRLTIDVIKRLLFLALGPTVVLLVAGPAMFTWVFGSEWETAGTFASLLAIYLLFQFVSSPVVHALTVFNQQKTFLMLNLVRTLLAVGIFLLAYVADLSPGVTIGIYSVGLSVHYIFTLFVVLRSIK